MISMESAEGIIKNIAKKQAFKIDNVTFEPLSRKEWHLKIYTGETQYTATGDKLTSEIITEDRGLGYFPMLHVEVSRGGMHIGQYLVCIEKPL